MRRNETLWEKKQRLLEEKRYQERIKQARNKGGLQIGEHVEYKHIHQKLKKRMLEKQKRSDRKHSDMISNEKMKNYKSQIDNDGEYLLKWLRLFRKLRDNGEFKLGDKYKHVQSLYMRLNKQLPGLDLKNITQEELILKISKVNPKLLQELIKIARPKKKKRRGRSRKGFTPRPEEEGENGRRKGRRRGPGRGRGELDNLIEEKYSKDGVKLTPEELEKKNAAEEEKAKNKFLAKFLPKDLQEKAEKKEKEKKELDEKVIQKELEVKMAKEIWGFVFKHVKKREDGMPKKKINFKNNRNRKGSGGGGNNRNLNFSGGLNDEEMDGNNRKKGSGFGTLKMGNLGNREISSEPKIEGDMDEYSGDEDDFSNGDVDDFVAISNDSEGIDKRTSKKDDKGGDMDDYSGDEEEDEVKRVLPNIKLNTSRKSDRRKRRKKIERPKIDFEMDETSTVQHDVENQDSNENNPPTHKSLQRIESGFGNSILSPTTPFMKNFAWDDNDSKSKTFGSLFLKGKPRFRNQRNTNEDEEEEEVDFLNPKKNTSFLDHNDLVVENEKEFAFVGISMIWLRALSHSSHMFLFTPIISMIDDIDFGLRKGGILGQMKCGVVPISKEGVWLTDHKQFAVEDPSQLIGKPLRFKLIIQSIKGGILQKIEKEKKEEGEDDMFIIETDEEDSDEDDDFGEEEGEIKAFKRTIGPRHVKAGCFVKYSLGYFKDTEITEVAEKVSNDGLLLNFEKEYYIPYVTKEVIFFLKNNAIRFEIFIKKKFVLGKKTLFSRTM